MKSTTKIFQKNVVSIDLPPGELDKEFGVIFTSGALEFLAELVTVFKNRVDKLYWNRLSRKCEIHLKKNMPEFADTKIRQDPNWKVSMVPPRLSNRKLDLGDVSPSNTKHFLEALGCDVQGIQVDFDDGHCPTWRNQILGLYNVFQVCHENFRNLGPINKLPILMLRPRAWNMSDHNILINGKAAPGPLVDFGLLMYHNAKILANNESGPFFYLSKLEGAEEAKLWNDVFIYSQNKIGIPLGTIRACVLIENILSSFEMEEILYELREHSLGLNCGIWDYAASIICKFGDNEDFLLPDRNKYVNMQKHFLKKYMDLVVQTCHSRGAHATGGMAALLVPSNEKTKQKAIESVIEAKRLEILAGCDGFMVYDTKLVPHINQLWKQECGSNMNQIHIKRPHVEVTVKDLLTMPSGGVTLEGLQHNVEVAILFIYNWLKGRGTFIYKGSVEDSATAEISRSQIWQWIRHKAIIEGTGEEVTKNLVRKLTMELGRQRSSVTFYKSSAIFLEIVTLPHFPDFITTYLNDHHVFRHSHAIRNNILPLQHKM